MEAPRYWAKAEQTAKSQSGYDFDLTGWACSASSSEEAQQRAQNRLLNLISHLSQADNLKDDYAYGRGVVREELIQEFQDSAGELTAMITRNRYGAMVLNTRDLLALDIDHPISSLWETIKGWFRKPSATPEALALDKLTEVLTPTQASFRVYATAAGLRVICTSHRYDPRSTEAMELMVATNTDRAYRALTRQQSCFRMRLTPKPWRIELDRMTILLEMRNSQVDSEVQAWLKEYEIKSKDFAVCRYLTTIGTGEMLPEFASLVHLHDELCRVSSDLPLA